jgi:hypothetical protein
MTVVAITNHHNDMLLGGGDFIRNYIPRPIFKSENVPGGAGFFFLLLLLKRGWAPDGERGSEATESNQSRGDESLGPSRSRALAERPNGVGLGVFEPASGRLGQA